MPQEIALYPLLTARENLAAFGELHGLSRRRRCAAQIDWALERTGLADRAAEPVKQFSGGMKRRLNIACGVLHRPRIVLLDEPTVGVDPQSRDRIYDMLADLAAEGVSLLLTTHHLEEAEARCSRTVIIDHGKVIAEGTLAELVDRTVGRHRLVTLRLDAPLADGHRRSCASRGTDRRRRRRTRLRARMTDVASELPLLLDRVRAGRPRGRGRGRPRPEPSGGVHPPHRKGAARVMWTLIRVGPDQPAARPRRAGDDVRAADRFLLDLRHRVRRPLRRHGEDQHRRLSTRTIPSSASGSPPD